MKLTFDNRQKLLETGPAFTALVPYPRASPGFASDGLKISQNFSDESHIRCVSHLLQEVVNPPQLIIRPRIAPTNRKPAKFVGLMQKAGKAVSPNQEEEK